MLVARVDVAIEPSDIADFADIFLNAFMPDRDSQNSSGAPTRRAVWRNHRAAADSAGFQADPVVIIDFIRAGSQFAVIVPSRIPVSVKRVVTRLTSLDSEAHQEKTRIPVTIQNCLQFINITTSEAWEGRVGSDPTGPDPTQRLV
ncbi:hypothetical protein C8R45DRAFT_1220703 [Mycena sanguinolenta]|nr:hypothetical protein C8R45DRAFT_1220703 [Mycena sanguinolenta]